MRGSTDLPMNRKQRRAMRMQSRDVAVASGPSQPSARAQTGRLFGQAVWHQHHGKPNEAVRLYKQVLELDPDHAEASNNLGCLLLAQGKRAAASACFERALMLLPQLFDYYPRTAASIGLKGRLLLKNAF
jgi:Tfp pilus assembly protein PilF